MLNPTIMGDSSAVNIDMDSTAAQSELSVERGNGLRDFGSNGLPRPRKSFAEKITWIYPKDKRMLHLMSTMYVLTLLMGLAISAACIYYLHFAKRSDIPIIGGIAAISVCLSMLYAFISHFALAFRPAWIVFEVLILSLNFLGWTTMFMLVPFSAFGFNVLLILCMIYLISFFAVGFLYQIRVLGFHKRVLFLEHIITLAISVVVAVIFGIAELKPNFYPEICLPLLACFDVQAAIYILHLLCRKAKTRKNVVYCVGQLMGSMPYGFLFFLLYFLYVSCRWFAELFLSRLQRRMRQLSRYEAKQRNLPELLKDAENEEEVMYIQRRIEAGALRVKEKVAEIDALRRQQEERDTKKLRTARDQFDKNSK